MVTFSTMLLDLRYELVEKLRVRARVDFAFDQLTRPGNRQRPDLLAQSIARFLYFQSDLLLCRIQNPRPFSGGRAFGCFDDFVRLHVCLLFDLLRPRARLPLEHAVSR